MIKINDTIKLISSPNQKPELANSLHLSCPELLNSSRASFLSIFFGGVFGNDSRNGILVGYKEKYRNTSPIFDLTSMSENVIISNMVAILPILTLKVNRIL